MGRDATENTETTPLVLESGGSACQSESESVCSTRASTAASSTVVASPGTDGMSKVRTTVVATSAALTYIVLSASMILFNKFLMRPDVFPFPVMLTSLHMVSSLSLATMLRSLCPSLFPAFSRVFAKKCGEQNAGPESPVTQMTGIMHSLAPFIPIAVCGAVYLVTGNSAYQYASVSFLQMVKESHVMFVYILMLLAGLDTFKLRVAAVLVVVAGSSMVAVYGEIYFSWLGLSLQLISGLSGSAQLVMNNLLMSRSNMGKIDPLTLVLCTAPVMFIFLIPANVFFWDARIPAQLQQWAPYILGNAVLAFCLQVSAATLIWVASATGYAVACVAKDLAIVAAAQVLLQESFTMIQVAGFTGSILGMALYSAMKVFPELFGTV